VFAQFGNERDARRREAELEEIWVVRTGAIFSSGRILLGSACLPRERFTIFASLCRDDFDHALGDDFQSLVTALDRKVFGAIAEVVVACGDKCRSWINRQLIIDALLVRCGARREMN